MFTPKQHIHTWPVIEAIAGISSNRAEAAELSRQLIEQNNILNGKEIPLIEGRIDTHNFLESITSVIGEIGSIKFNREDAVSRAKKYQKSENLFDTISLITSIGQIRDTNSRDEICELLETLIRESMNNQEISKILKAIHEIKNKRHEVVNLTKELVKDHHITNEILDAIRSLGALRSDRKNIVSLMKTLSTLLPDELNIYDTGYLLSEIQKIRKPSNNVARILLMARKFKISTQDSFYNLIDTVSSTRLSDSLDFEELEEIDFNDLVENPYEEGIDAHEPGRDQRAIEAINLLQEYWHPTSDDVNHEWSDFFGYITAVEPSIQSLALRSLGLDEEGNILPKPENESFSGLVAGVEERGAFRLSAKNIATIQVNGKDLMARFWHFAKTYESGIEESSPPELDSQDHENMKKGIIDALAKGVDDEDNELVCEMGRVQLLQLATLKGRLKYPDGRMVDIDQFQVSGEPTEETSIRNLHKIAEHLDPFISSLDANITSAEDFYNKLFTYRNNLQAGEVPSKPRVNLDASEVVYFVRMMEPITFQGKITGYDINPNQSLISQFSFDDDFMVDDYLEYFGEQDLLLLAEARAKAEAEAEAENQIAILVDQENEDISHKRPLENQDLQEQLEQDQFQQEEFEQDLTDHQGKRIRRSPDRYGY